MSSFLDGFKSGFSFNGLGDAVGLHGVKPLKTNIENQFGLHGFHGLGRAQGTGSAALLAYLAGSAALGGLGGSGASAAPIGGGGTSVALDPGVAATGSGAGPAGTAPGTDWSKLFNKELLSKGLTKMGGMGQQRQNQQGQQNQQPTQIDQNMGWYAPAPQQFDPNQNNYNPQQLAAMLRRG